MKKVFWIIMITVVFGIVSCGKSREQRVQEIKNYEEEIDIDSNVINEETGDNLIYYYTKFAKDFPKDTLSPAYLFRAAEVAMNIQNTSLSIELLDQIIMDYPNFDELPLVYFMKGYVYENAGEKEKARNSYNEFLEKYPGHFMAKDARMLLDVIDLTPEELIEKLIMQEGIQDTIAA